MEHACIRDTWYIAHNGADIVHYGKIDTGNVISTGQPHLEVFEDEASWRVRLLELGVSEGEINEN